MGAGFIASGFTPAMFRGDFDSTQEIVVVSNIDVTVILRPDSNRFGIVIQNTGAFTVAVAFRTFDFSFGAMQIIPGAAPLKLNFSDLGPIIGDGLLGLSTGVAGLLYVLTASDRGRGRR